jgi:hypothetical protein
MDNGSIYPVSVFNKIILPIKEELFLIENNTYITTFLSHLISKEEYDQVVQGANKVMGTAWHKKRSNDIVKTPNFVSYMAGLSVVLVFMYMFFIYMSTLYQSPGMLVVALICVGLGSIIAIGLSIYNYFRSVKAFVSIQEYVKKELDEYICKINDKYFDKLRFINRDMYIECNILKPISEGSYKKKHSVLKNNVDGLQIDINNMINTETGLKN